MIGVQEALYKATEDNRELEKRIKELEEENKKLKNVINELSKHLVTTFNKTQNTDYLDIKIKLDELIYELIKGGE